MTASKRCVIVVEDDLAVLRAVRRVLVGAGLEVRAFDRPSAVLRSVLPATEACLLLDMQLPEMNGIELREMLAAAGCQLPTVMMTGAPDDATCKSVLRIKAAAVLYKPFARVELLAAVNQAFSRGAPVENRAPARFVK